MINKIVKSKGEKERYTYLNAEFQRITRRDKKAFLSNQCKDIEENYRMGKTRDLFKKIIATPLKKQPAFCSAFLFSLSSLLSNCSLTTNSLTLLHYSIKGPK